MMAGLMAEIWFNEIVDLMAGYWVAGMCVSIAVLMTGKMAMKMVGLMAEHWIDKMVG